MTDNKAYYQANKDKWKIDTEEKKQRKRANQKAYVERNKERVKAYKNRWTEENFNWILHNRAKNRARRAGLEFNLEVSDIIIPLTCKYLGVTLTKGWGKGKQLTHASIDRIDNTKGYIKGNIQIISRLANEMKRDATIEQLISFAKGILKEHKGDMGQGRLSSSKPNLQNFDGEIKSLFTTRYNGEAL